MVSTIESVPFAQFHLQRTSVEHPEGLEKEIPNSRDPITPQDENIPALVAEQHPPFLRQTHGRTSVAHTHDGCKPVRLGSSSQGPPCTGELELLRKEATDQPCRDSGNPTGLDSLTTRLKGSSHRGGLHQPPGGHKKQRGSKQGQSHLQMGRSIRLIYRLYTSQNFLNWEADDLSRQSLDPGEWSLKDDIFHEITQRWGIPEVDFMATRHNHKFPIFVA